MNSLLFKHTNRVVDIGFFLKQMFTKKEKTNALPLVKIDAPLFLPAFIALDIGKIDRCIGMVKPHVRYINNGTDRHRLTKIFTQNQSEHVGDILRRGLHPVRIDHQPVLEILRLVGHQWQHGSHDFHQLHIAVEGIFITTLHQHFRHLFHHIGHTRLAIASGITANFGERHRFRHGLKNKERLHVGRSTELLFKPVNLLLKVDHAHKDTISLLNSRCRFRILLIKINIA